MSDAERIAVGSGLSRRNIRTASFLITTFSRFEDPSLPVNVYVEGDGLAFKSRRRVSSDPTPVDPVALRLAAQDPAGNVLYIARPCQMLTESERSRCHAEDWTLGRFSDKIIESVDHAADAWLAENNARGIHLIGFSGGGAVAALLASRRQDVLSLRTVAGNLDHVALTRYHKTTPLSRSLNPADYADPLAAIPQIHFSGENDKIVPPWLAQIFNDRFRDPSCVDLVQIPGADHRNGWEEIWPKLLQMRLPCGQNST